MNKPNKSKKYFSFEEKRIARNQRKKERNIRKNLIKSKEEKIYFNTKTKRLNKYLNNAQKQRIYRNRKKQKNYIPSPVEE